MNYRVSIVLEQDENRYFAYSPELPGCYSQGESYEEAIANIKEAVDLYIETLDPEERIQLLSKQISTSSIEVSIAWTGRNQENSCHRGTGTRRKGPCQRILHINYVY